MARKKRKHIPRGYRILERGGSYTAQVRVAGFASAGKTFPTEAAAVEWATAQVAELRKSGARDNPRRDLLQTTIGDLVRAFLDEPNIKGQKSYGDTARLLAWWVNKFGAVKVSDFGVVKLREEARPLLMRDRSGSTVNRYLSALRTAWNWGRDAGYVINERAWPRRLMLKEPRGIVRFLSDEELTRLLEASKADPMMDAAIRVSLATGMRQGEVRKVKWSDIDLDKATLLVQDHKGGDTIKVVHLVPEAVDAFKALKKLPVVSLKHPFVIHDKRSKQTRALGKSTLESRWRKIRTAAKFESRFRWHDLRHSTASYLAQAGATDLEIAEVTGHKTLAMVQRYAHLKPGAAVTGHSKIGEKLRGK
jgi:integrase